ncbi:hypothetical protein AA0114_g12549 [Alternaria tenuissima]|uniref:C2H2-type domain-containing protein n=1 Tax=Alternaria tenuissima TaxID=119927 RepID=A0A4Q4LZT7_9PLEO|nr:hypothetical protein AA0114_g12549 [Alternaria tenuissima]
MNGSIVNASAWSLAGSPTLVEDAQAVLNGDANYLLGYNEALADVEGPYDIYQGILNAVAPHVMYIPAVPQVSGPNIMPYGAPSQLQPQVPVAPTHPASNNQAQHAAVTAPLQCPHGCTSTFRRREDYRRHMKKHTGPFFPCTYPNCSKMFYRQDKLRDHLAKGH